MKYETGLGIDEEIKEPSDSGDDGVIDINAAKEKRRPFHYWEVAGKEHKLKLTTQMIEHLEKKYRCNMLTLVMDGDIPPLSTMLTVVQAAMSPWQHKVRYETVRNLYDSWLEEDGNQLNLFMKVIIPTMAVSGFFTESQAEGMMEQAKNMDVDELI